MKRGAIFLFLLAGISLLFSPLVFVQAQSGLRLNISTPDLSQFPKVTLYLDVYDQQGNFASDLTLRNVSLLEDGHARIVNETFLTQPGLDTIVAINLSPTLSNRSTSGSTRFQDLNAALFNWINTLPTATEQDRYTLTGNEGILAERVKDRSGFVSALQGYQPNLFNLKPNLGSLDSALTIAAKGNSIPYGKQVIFYLTALPLENELEKIPGMIQRANQMGVPVFVWLVAPDASENSTAATALAELAQKTGGKYFLYGESKQAPNPEQYFIPLRYSYRVRYTSAVNTSGSHRVALQIQRGDQSANSREVVFGITLNNPMPELINLPLQIARIWALDTSNNLVLQPDLLILQMKVDFPDGYPRQLKSSRLLVDGEVLIQNDQPPFDFFGWPLKNYRNNGDHTLQVEAEDILGYKGQSITVTIPITVAPRSNNFWGRMQEFIQNGGWMIAALLALTGMGAIAYRQRHLFTDLLEKRKAAKAMETYDPLTQPVIAESGEIVGRRTEMEAAEADEQHPIDTEPPKLLWVGERMAPEGLKMISLMLPENFIGRDAKQCQIVIKEPTIEKVHAVITLASDGHARIANRSEKNGTWLNYAPVSSGGALLHEGDLIHFGKVGFRYQIGRINMNANERDQV